MSTLKSLLFIAPIMPAARGNGLAMRAGVFLGALARDFAVTLLIVPVSGGAGPVTRFVRRRTRRVVTLSLTGMLDPLWELSARVLDPVARTAGLAAYPRPALCRHATTPCLAAARDALAELHFDAVHVMRSYLAPYAEPFLADVGDASPFTSIDLDDDEALNHARLAALYRGMGRDGEAAVASAEAIKYTRLEADWLPRFGLRMACAPDHAERLAAAWPSGKTAVLPNTVAVPWLTPRWRAHGQRILFVGNLSYLPNSEGVRQFATLTLPLLRARLGHQLALRIAGSAPTPEVAELAREPGIEVLSNPRDLARHYRWADLCIVPLAAGGGTRIKLLEAFAHGVPVVATPVGAEGIAATDRVHLLLAEPPEAFAAACAEVLSDVQLASRLRRQARQLVATTYEHATGVRTIRQMFGWISAG